MNLHEITSYLDKLLDVEKIGDYGINGLQVENSGVVEEIYGGVDISLEIVKKCPPQSLLIVHHGMFWAVPITITKNIYKIVKLLIEKDCALYGVHLPLDGHEEFGNNHGFYKLTGWNEFKTEPFGETKGNYLSSIVEFPEERNMKEILGEVHKILGKDLIFWNFGKEKIKRAAFVSGGAAKDLTQALSKDLDLYITGETSHNSYWYAKDNNINVIFAGHYNTETIGIKLLGKHLAEKFNINHTFVDLPTCL